MTDKTWLDDLLRAELDEPPQGGESPLPLWGDNDDQRLGPRSRNAVFFREMFGESAALLEQAEALRRQFEAFLETRTLFVGTDSQPGLMMIVEAFHGQIQAIEKNLSELTSISQSALEMRDLSQNLLVAIPDRLLGTLKSQLFDERLREAISLAVVDLGHEIAVARLQMSAEQIAGTASEEAQRVFETALAKHDAENALQLCQKLDQLEQQHDLDMKRLIGQHQIALEHAEAALAEAQRAAERMEKQRDKAEERLQRERRMQGRNSLQWGGIAFAVGVGLTLFLHQPTLSELSNLIKSF